MRIASPSELVDNEIPVSKNADEYRTNIKVFINVIQKDLSTKMKRNRGEHHKTYITRLFKHLPNVSAKYHNQITTYQGFFVLQNAHRERLRKLFYKQNIYSLKQLNKILN